MVILVCLIGKLKEFNAMMEGDEKVDEADLVSLTDVMSGKDPTAPQLQLLWKLLQWPNGKTTDTLKLLFRKW